MQVTTELLTKAITTWINNDLLPRSSLVQQGIITFCLLQGKKKLEHLVSLLTSLDPEIEEDIFFRNLDLSLEKMGGYYEIPFINYRLDKQDIHKIKEILDART